jgi:hypothetical protein
LIRDALLEYGDSPFDDQYILGKMNEIYKFAYNHLSKAEDDYFGTVYPLEVVGNQSDYVLPSRIMWQKRIAAILIPNPTQLNQDPWRYVKVPRVQYKQSGGFQTTKVKSYVPSCWTMLGETLYLFPVPVVGYTAKVILTPRLAPLGIYSGKIVDIDQVNGTITLDQLNDDNVATYVSNTNKAFISIADRNTGLMLNLLPYNAVNTSTYKITLAQIPKSRTMFEGVELSDYSSTDVIGVASSVTITDIKYQSKVVGVLGDNVRVAYVGGGTAGAETVAVTGKGTSTSPYVITVTIQTGVSTATQIKTAIEASATASGYLHVSITGTGSNTQVVTAATSLTGGEDPNFGIDDVVSFGYSTAASIFGEAFDTLIVDWVVQKIRGVLNETDPETVATLKLKLEELKSDTCGRDMGIRIERVSYVRPTYAFMRR